MNEMNELYKNIPGYNGKYQVSNLGNVRSLQCKEPRILQQFDRDKCGHKYVELCKDGVSKKFLIHRLVAEAFIPNPDNLPIVMHKDNDPLNNHVSNLKWGTQSDNIQQAFDEGRKISPYKGQSHPNCYEVYNEDTGDHIICDSRSEVSDLIGYEEISLKNMVGNGRKIALGPYKGYQIRRMGNTIKARKY